MAYSISNLKFARSTVLDRISGMQFEILDKSAELLTTYQELANFSTLAAASIEASEIPTNSTYLTTLTQKIATLQNEIAGLKSRQEHERFSAQTLTDSIQMLEATN